MHLQMNVGAFFIGEKMENKMTTDKTHWNDIGLHKTYGHNNNGYVWGINYIDEDLDDGEIIKCEWFKTRQERNQKYKKRR